MDSFIEARKSILIVRLTIFLRKVCWKILPSHFRYFFREKDRKILFDRAMGQFMENPSAYAHASNPILVDLIYGWGNTNWSALDEYLVACINHALESKGAILECGSGLSTILIGVVAKKQGLKHFALEHTAEWGAKVQGYLDQYRLDSVMLSVSPLKDYGDYTWYTHPISAMPDSFSLVICDGPPSTTAGGRYGLVPIMKKKLQSGSVILLDDAERKEEQEIAKRWGEELNASIDMQATKKPYIKMVVA